jgi:hypothetical protein
MSIEQQSFTFGAATDFPPPPAPLTDAERMELGDRLVDSAGSGPSADARLRRIVRLPVQTAMDVELQWQPVTYAMNGKLHTRMEWRAELFSAPADPPWVTVCYADAFGEAVYGAERLERIVVRPEAQHQHAIELTVLSRGRSGRASKRHPPRILLAVLPRRPLLVAWDREPVSPKLPAVVHPGVLTRNRELFCDYWRAVAEAFPTPRFIDTTAAALAALATDPRGTA